MPSLLSAPIMINKFFKLLIIIFILIAELLIIEGTSRLLLTYTFLGVRLKQNPYPSYTPPLKLPVYQESLPTFDKILIRDPNIKVGYDTYAHVDRLPEGKLAVLNGGSAPHGVIVNYDESFWGQLDNEQAFGMRFVNAAVSAVTMIGANASMNQALKMGYVQIAALYVGDNEWQDFEYPRFIGDNPIYYIDSKLREYSRAYELLSLFLRHGVAHYSLATHENYHTWQWYQFNSYCYDNRYTDYDLYPPEELQAFRKRELENFSRKLDQFTSLIKDKKIITLFFTTPIRYRLNPCFSRPQLLTERYAGKNQEFEMANHVEKGLQAYQYRDFELAKIHLLKANTIDDRSAIVNNYLGYTFEALHDFNKARYHFEISRDTMVGKNGLLPTFNNIIRSKENHSKNIYVIDLEKLFLNHSIANSTGLNDDIIDDWCHPNVEGHNLIANEIRRILGQIL